MTQAQSTTGRRPAAAVAGALALAAGTGALVLGAAPAGAAVAGPPGNNGTVKIDEVPFDDHPNNEPHVGCVFQVDLYGYDEGDLTATVGFEGVAPTGGGELLVDELDIGEDEAGGGTDLDASGTYDLTEALAGIEPHPQQGWHVKLTVHAEGSQGADVKHKVFWVSGCETEHPTTTTTPTTTPDSSTTTAPGSSTTTAPSPSSSTSVPGSTVTTGPGPSSTVPGAPSPSGPSTSAAPSPTTVPAVSGSLPRTGSTIAPLVATGAGLLAVGAALIAVVRLRRRPA